VDTCATPATTCARARWCSWRAHGWARPKWGSWRRWGARRSPARARPRVAVLTTGDELLAPSEPLHAGGVRNSNAFSVPALVERAGAEVATVEVAPDDPAALRAALDRALERDVVVVCGGVSVGEHDHVRAALADLAAEQVFWGLRCVPAGRPGSGVREGGSHHGPTLVFGLPGNPVSAMVTFVLLARPAIRALLEAAPEDPWRTTATLDETYEKHPGRAHAVRCRLELRDDGWHARPTKDRDRMCSPRCWALTPSQSCLRRAAP